VVVPAKARREGRRAVGRTGCRLCRTFPIQSIGTQEPRKVRHPKRLVPASRLCRDKVRGPRPTQEATAVPFPRTPRDPRCARDDSCRRCGGHSRGRMPGPEKLDRPVQKSDSPQRRRGRRERRERENQRRTAARAYHRGHRDGSEDTEKDWRTAEAQRTQRTAAQSKGKCCRSKDRRYMGEPFLFQSLRKSAVVGA